jgi:hypothetical protein
MQMYKDEHCIEVEPKQKQLMLDSGWSLTPVEVVEKEAEAEKESEAEETVGGEGTDAVTPKVPRQIKRKK